MYTGEVFARSRFVSVGDGASTSRIAWNNSHIVHPFCAGATKTATEVCKYTQLEFLDLFTCFCYTINEDMKGGESDGQGGQGRNNKQTFG